MADKPATTPPQAPPGIKPLPPTIFISEKNGLTGTESNGAGKPPRER